MPEEINESGQALVRCACLLRLREKDCPADQRAGGTEGVGGPGRRSPGAVRASGRGAPRTEGECGTQVLPRLRPGEDGADRRGLAPGEEHAKSYRLLGQQN